MHKKDFSYGVIPLRKNAHHQWVILLIQHQSGHWSYPKGGQEIGESPKETAARELEEETGVRVKHWLPFPPFREHYFFRRKEELVEKWVSYYLAEVTAKVVIQEEEIADYRWSSLEEAGQLLTYPESKRILKEIAHLIQ